MNRRTQRLIGEGLGCGMIAGMLFGVAVLFVDAVAFEQAPLMPIKRTASIILGTLAFIGDEGQALLIGTLLHIALSGIFGFLYAGLNLALARRRLKSFAWQAASGAVYGLMLWFVNFQIIARFTFPSLAAVDPLSAALLHAFAYGAPLGILLAGAEREPSTALAPQLPIGPGVRSPST